MRGPNIEPREQRERERIESRSLAKIATSSIRLDIRMKFLAIGIIYSFIYT